MALPERRASFSSLVSCIPYLTCGNWITIIPYPVHSSVAERLTVWDASEFADRVGMIFAFYNFACVARSLK